MNDATDLLLLNVSNYPRVPLFPYAFVQVSEVARRHGLRVRTVDLLYTPEAELGPKLTRLLDALAPRAVGVHLRQLDSLFVEEYRGYWPRDAGASPSTLPGGAMVGADGSFRPVEATQRLVAMLRDRTRAPIFLGGHGFTSNPQAVFERVAPDVGVVGEPDALFSSFEAVLARRDLASVPNLMFEEAGKIIRTPRVNFGPAEGPEYTDEIIDEVKRFYGLAGLANQQTFSVEAIRGCPYNCYFCCEPAVKGKDAKIRNIDAVVDDVDRLTSHGLDRIWMVCSELNVFGPDHALALAERFIALTEKTGRRLRWYAFSLPSRMNLDIWRALARSGFRGGFNTFQSLDDENLQRGRIPHRAIDAIEEYKNIETVSRELPAGDEIRSRGTMALFLGNAYATTETVARSLRALAEHGLLETVKIPGIMVATRVFETLESDDARKENELLTFGGASFGGAVDLSLPSFEYPAALVRHFGGRRPLERFMAWLDMTLLSKLHERTKDWPLFLANWTSPEELSALVGGLEPASPRSGETRSAALDALVSAPTQEKLRGLFWPSPIDRAESQASIEELLALLFSHEAAVVSGVLAMLGLPASVEATRAMPIYDLLSAVYARFDTEEALVAAVRERFGDVGARAQGVAVLFARWLLYLRNVVLDPRYPAALFGGQASETTPPRRHLDVVRQ